MIMQVLYSRNAASRVSAAVESLDPLDVQPAKNAAALHRYDIFPMTHQFKVLAPVQQGLEAVAADAEGALLPIFGPIES